MADSFIQVAPDSTGKMMQTYLNTISGNPVHAEAVSLVDTSGNPITTLNVNIGTSTLNASVSGTVNAIQSGDWTVKSANASNFLTSVSGTVTAQQSNASNFLATISGTVTAVQSNASNQLVTASQGGTWNIGTVATITNPVAATQSGTWNIGTVSNPGNVGTKEMPDSTATYAPTVASSTAYANNIIIKASPGVLYNLTGYNSKTTSQFILLLNATTVLGNGNATSFPALNVPAGQTFSLDFGGKFGRFFSTGMVVVNSSTANTVTIGSADCWFDALYS